MLIQEDYFKNIFNTDREAILILDENLRVLPANRSFFTIFKEDRRGNKKLFCLLKSILLMLLIAGFLLCLMSCKKKEKVAGPPEKITIAYSTASNAMLMYIAFAKGYFAEEGLIATPQPHAFGKMALNAVLEGKADLATVGDTAFVFAVMNGKKIATLATIQTSNKNKAIVARRDRGITKPADLKGKKIGVALGTTSEFFGDSFLLANNLERTQVTLIDMKPEEMAEALGKGRVDAVSTFNPTIKQLEKGLGNSVTVFFGESVYTETFCVAAEQEYVKKNPEAIKKVLRALLRAETFVKQYPEEARRLIADFIKADKSILDDTWNILNFKITLDQALLVNFEDQTRWMLKERLTAGTDMPNYLNYVYLDGLAAVKPEAVRIIK